MSRKELFIIDDDSIITMLHRQIVIKSGLYSSPRLFFTADRKRSTISATIAMTGF